MGLASGAVRLLEGYLRQRARRQQKRGCPALTPGVFDYLAGAKSDHFTVGFAARTIMPADLAQKKYYIAGYGSNNPAKGKLDDLTANAMWIDDNSGRGGVVLVSLDVVGLLNRDVQTIRALLRDFCRESGCRAVHVMSIHNHAGIDTMGIWGPLPRSGKNKAYMQIVFAGVCEAVRAAREDARAGQLYLGQRDAPDWLQCDIRLPVVYSKTLTRLRFVPKDGSRETWLVHFASHSEALQGRNNLVSADFPGYMRREIAAKTGANVLYVVGAIGGMISINDIDPDNVKMTQMAGLTAAETAMNIQTETRLTPIVNLLREELYIPTENVVLMLAARIGLLNADSFPTGDGRLLQSLKTEMTYLTIGEQAFLLLPGELFPELHQGGYLSEEESAAGVPPDKNPLPLQQIAQDETLLVVGLANDEIGYILPPNDFLLDEAAPYLNQPRDRHGRRHYEETNSLGPHTAGCLAQTFKHMMQTINEKRGQPE